MIIPAPRSLTATVYVRFDYGEETKKASELNIELLNKVFDKASEMSPDMQEILVEFATHLNELERKGKKEDG